MSQLMNESQSKQLSPESEVSTASKVKAARGAPVKYPELRELAIKYHQDLETMTAADFTLIRSQNP